MPGLRGIAGRPVERPEQHLLEAVGVQHDALVAVLRRVWARHFERDAAGPDTGEISGDGVRLRPAQGRGPGDRIESPYDSEARFRAKAGTSWTGYMVHLTETCDAGALRLVVHADTTPANVHEAPRTGPIHDALRDSCTLGEVCAAMREVFGEYRPEA